MKIHFDTLTPSDLYRAAHIAGVEIERADYTGSMTHKGKVDVILSGSSNHRVNFSRDDIKAATWDQWGVFLRALWVADPAIVTGPYGSEYAFHVITGDRFKLIETGEAQPHRQHKWENTGPYEFECKCGASLWNHFHPTVSRIREYDAERLAERKAERKAERLVAREAAKASA